MTNYYIKFKLTVIIGILLLRVYSLNAQLCTGSLGSPVVNITFGSGNVSPSSISGFSTTYTYVPSSCPLDGNYTIMSNSPYCFGGTWWTLNTDHTPNSVNGDMMIINASNAPSDFFIDTVSGLCGGTTYEFAAWILNLNVPSACGGNPVKGDITFSIETVGGTVIQQYKTGSIPVANSALWVQYGFYFTAPANSGTIVIRMRNNAPGGCGNDLAIDDITLRPCGPLVKTATSLGSNHINDCDNDTTHYTFSSTVSSGFSNIQYQWQLSTDTGKTWNDIPGAVNNSYYLATNTIGDFEYRLTIAEGTSINISDCRVISDTIFYNRYVSPTSSLIKSFNVCIGDSIIEKGDSTLLYQWTGPSAFSSTQSTITIHNITVSEAGKYFASISNMVGCSTTDSFMLNITSKPVIPIIPTQNICLGDTAILRGGGGTGIYSWTPATYLLTPNDSVTKAFPLDSTTYTLLATNGICSSSQLVHINVLARPSSNLIRSFNICTGDSILEKGDSTLLYQWTGPSSFSSTQSTITIQSITVAEAGKYLAIISNSVGCTTSDSFVLNVTTKPVVWTISGKNICLGDIVTLSGGGGTGNYYWTPATYLLTPNDSVTKAFPIDSTTYTLHATNGICSDSQTVLINVRPRPVSNFSKYLNECSGDTILVKGDSTLFYQWTGPNAYSSFLSTIFIAGISMSDAGTYTAIVSNSAGCFTKDSFNLQVNKTPVAWAIADTAVCQGDTILLQGGGGTSYSWKPAISLLTPNDSSTKAYPSNATTYTLYVTNGICTNSKTVQVGVWQNPSSFIAPVLPIYLGNSTALSGQISGTDVSYSWSPLMYLTNPNTLSPLVVLPDTSTMYYLTVKSNHDCGLATDSVLVQVNKPMQPLLIPNTFSPNGDGIHDTWIIGNIDTYPNADVKVFNRDGNIVYYSPQNFNSWDGKIHGSPVPMGTYYYLIDLHNSQPVISGWLLIIR